MKEFQEYIRFDIIILNIYIETTKDLVVFFDLLYIEKREKPVERR